MKRVQKSCILPLVEYIKIIQICYSTNGRIRFWEWIRVGKLCLIEAFVDIYRKVCLFESVYSFVAEVNESLWEL